MCDMRSRLITLRQIVAEAGMTFAGLPSDIRFFETGEGTEHFMYVLDSSEMPDVGSSMLGGISISKSRDGSWGVGSVSAAHGYGPMMYRLAMEWVAENGGGRGLTKNTHGETSPDAQRVWDRFDVLSDDSASGIKRAGGAGTGLVSRTGELRLARTRWIQLTPAQENAAWGMLVDLEIGN